MATGLHAGVGGGADTPSSLRVDLLIGEGSDT
jgi:hypothetical protein